MKIKKAFWTSLALTPAAIIPLSTATSCSQSWGYKTPLSIGSNIKGDALDPFNAFSDTSLVDLNKDQIIPYLQSNYAINTRSSTLYGYSLPQKWNADKAVQAEERVKWENGDFEDGSAGWYEYSSSDFVKSNTRKGVRDGNVNVSETIYSYRNNTQASAIELVDAIGSSMSSILNYALQYQGTQIGTEWKAVEETDTNLATSWGGDINHGDKGSEQNKTFFEGIFAANAVSGSSKTKAALHPTHIEFNFKNSMFPIAAYKVGTDGKIAGVHDTTLKLLNGVAKRPSAITDNKYWTSVTDDQKETITDVRTGDQHTYTYKVYTYNNVPVIVNFNSLTRAYVDPTKNDSFIVSDYYSETSEIKKAIGTSWNESLPKFASDVTEPTYCGFTYNHPTAAKKAIELASDKVDTRVKDNLDQNSFIVLLNYAYKEYQDSGCESLDRVTMTGLNTILPAYLLDKSVELNENFFVVASSGDNKGYILDTTKVNKYNNLLNELFKRSAGQGLVTEANKLNDTSKQLLKLLSFMFGQTINDKLVVNTGNIITPYKLK